MQYLGESIARGMGEILKILYAIGRRRVFILDKEFLQSVQPSTQGQLAFILEGSLEIEPHARAEEHPAQKEYAAEPNGQAA